MTHITDNLHENAEEKSTFVGNSALTEQLNAIEDRKSALPEEEISKMVYELAKVESSAVREAMMKRFSKVAKIKLSEVSGSVMRIRRESERKAAAERVKDWWEGLCMSLPEKYGISEAGVHKYGAKEDEQITTAPFWVNSLVHNLSEDSEEVEIAWRMKRGQKSVIVPREKFFNVKDFVSIAKHGVPLIPSKGYQAADYAMYFIQENQERLEDNKKYLSRTPGWTQLPDGSMRFGAYSEDIIFDADGKNPAARHLTAKGTYEGWLEIRKYVEKSPRLAFLMATSMTAPLLEKLKEAGFILDQFGPSGTGKTTSLCIAASMVGAPGGQLGPGLVTPWDQTPTYAEAQLSFFSDMPIFCMDSHELKEEPLEKMAYMIANGAGRGRANREGGLKARSEHRSVVVSDGEWSMCERLTKDGAKNRIISLRGAASKNLEVGDIDHVNSIIRNNYGHVTPRVIKKIQEVEFQLHEIHKANKDIYSEKARASRQGGRIAAYFASIATAAQVISQIEGMEWFKSAADVALEEAWFSAVEENQSESSSGKALRLIADWVMREDRNFTDSAEVRYTVGSACYGRIEEGKFVAFIPSELHKFLAAYGYKSPKALLEKWAEDGVVISKQANFQKSIRIQGKSTHAYEFAWNKLYDQEETNAPSAEEPEKAQAKVIGLVPKDASVVKGKLLSIREVQNGPEKLTYLELEEAGNFAVKHEHRHVLQRLANARAGRDAGSQVMIAFVMTDLTNRRYVIDAEVVPTEPV